MKALISFLIIFSSFNALAYKIDSINWYRNNFNKLSNSLDLGEFYSNIIDENLISVKLGSDLAEAVFEGYADVSLEIDENGYVKYVHLNNYTSPFIFEIKRSRIHPIFVLRLTAHNKNSHLSTGPFLYTGSQFIYFKEKEARGGRKPKDRYKLLERILFLNNEFKTRNMLEFNLEYMQMDGSESYFTYRLFSINEDYTFCLHLQNSDKPYKAEIIKAFFDLLELDYTRSKCEIKYQFEYPFKDPKTRIWYESSPNRIKVLS